MRLQLRILKFVNLHLYSRHTPLVPNVSDNKFDDTFKNVLEVMRPALHTVMLAHKLKKINAIKTNP